MASAAPSGAGGAGAGASGSSGSGTWDNCKASGRSQVEGQQKVFCSVHPGRPRTACNMIDDGRGGHRGKESALCLTATSRSPCPRDEYKRRIDQPTAGELYAPPPWFSDHQVHAELADAEALRVAGGI